jgi:hypothetical protein
MVPVRRLIERIWEMPISTAQEGIVNLCV